MTFNPGDKVRFIDPNGSSYLTIGTVYTVAENKGLGTVRLVEVPQSWGGRWYRFNENRFELVESKPVVNPDEWTPLRADHASRAAHPDTQGVSTIATRQAAVLFLLLHLARHVRWTLADPADDTVTLTVKRSTAEEYAKCTDVGLSAAFLDVAVACKEALADG